MIIEVPLSHLEPDPDQVRKSFYGIELLAEAISELGLLQNLVVEPIRRLPSEGEDEQRYKIRAGERRYRALRSLAEKGQWPEEYLPKKMIPCLVHQDGDLANLAENEGHESVFIWETGAGYLRLADKGYTQAQIAKTVCKSQAHVSMCMTIARGLSEKVRPHLVRLGLSGPNMQVLAKIASLEDRHTLRPDTERQMKALSAYLCRPKKKQYRRQAPAAIEQRVQKLAQTDVPDEIVPWKHAFVQYLTGETNQIVPPI